MPARFQPHMMLLLGIAAFGGCDGKRKEALDIDWAPSPVRATAHNEAGRDALQSLGREDIQDQERYCATYVGNKGSRVVYISADGRVVQPIASLK